MTDATTAPREDKNAWPALWALCVGFFMIMIDGTIVSVSIPSIMAAFDTSVSNVIWVSSAYLLTYAVPLLITGRLGDRFGPKRLYMIGLTVFTLASAWCGFSPTIGQLIVARGVQGLGSALMAPQTMAIVTRLFPPNRRGAPMGLWGATASVASLVGPILGGFLTDALSWRWIFWVNLPVGIIAMLAVWRLVPHLTTHSHRFDWLGVALNGTAVFLMVFALQEGQGKGWPWWIWLMIAAGVALMGVFVATQRRNPEPLMPLDLFRNRNFTAANLGIFVMGCVVVAMSFPMMLFLQSARGLTPTRAALLGAPTAVVSFVLAGVVGKAVNTRPAKPFILAGFATFAVSMLAYALLMRPGVSVLWLMIPATFLGAASACIWGPLSMSATRDLSARTAGAGSGIYNATRQLGSVLGSAAIATIIEWQLASNLPAGGHAPSTPTIGHAMPAFIGDAYTTAMRHAEYFPTIVAALGIFAALLLVKPKPFAHEQAALNLARAEAERVAEAEANDPAGPIGEPGY